MDKSFAYDLLKERGIVSMRVDLCHDLLRLSLRSHDLLHNKLLYLFQRGGVRIHLFRPNYGGETQVVVLYWTGVTV